MYESTRLHTIDNIAKKAMSPFLKSYYATGVLFSAMSTMDQVPWNYKPNSRFLHTPNEWLVGTVEKGYMPQSPGKSGIRVASETKKGEIEGYL